jgi:hypothetical protein
MLVLRRNWIQSATKSNHTLTTAMTTINTKFSTSIMAKTPPLISRVVINLQGATVHQLTKDHTTDFSTMISLVDSWRTWDLRTILLIIPLLFKPLILNGQTSKPTTRRICFSSPETLKNSLPSIAKAEFHIHILARLITLSWIGAQPRKSLAFWKQLAK